MENFDLGSFTGGWFVGDFSPTLLPTEEFEVAVKSYAAGAHEQRHLHKIATELTVIVNGRVRMNGEEYGSGSIIRINPGEDTDFEALTDVTTVVVKTPCAKNDKYLI
ncbi:MAG: hypothetical protein JWP27_370 [Flaviaesturariibacter sp.]|nr:hypothetical protein [Flaviaesturariibacter sp.]